MGDISVVIIEDHDLTRFGIKAALNKAPGIKVVADISNGREGLKILSELQPDVAIIDIGLPDIDGIELTQTFKQSHLQKSPNPTKIMILTMHSDKDAVLAAFAAGADSYSLKDVSTENLIQAIRVTSEGNSWIDPNIARIVLQQTRKDFATKPRVIETNLHQGSQHITIESLDDDTQKIIDSESLTERELEVLELIVAGCSNAQIAEKLYITVGTVKTHVCSILNKLCAHDRTQAAVRALRSGLVE